MAEYVLTQASIENQLTVTLFADTVTLLPTRVEVRGISGRYRFFVTSPDRTRSFTTTFDSDVNVSRTIGNAVASRYTPDWIIGIEGV
jgi:hypothetical protein